MDVPSSIWKYMPSLICGCALFYIWMYPLPYGNICPLSYVDVPSSIYGCTLFCIRKWSTSIYGCAPLPYIDAPSSIYGYALLHKYECVHLPYMDVPCSIICICLSTIYGCNFIGTCMLCMLNTADNLRPLPHPRA